MLLACNCHILIAAAVLVAAWPGDLKASAVCVKVDDYANLPLHDARVTVVNLATSKVLTAVTGRDGKACVRQIPEGLYSVEVGLAGFLNVRYYPVRLSHPAVPELNFRLPFGEITEGGLATDAIISGTLRQDAAPVGDAKICLLGSDDDQTIACTITNELGEYALSAPPGDYGVEVTLSRGITHRSKIGVPAPGVYRNRIVIPTTKPRVQ